MLLVGTLHDAFGGLATAMSSVQVTQTTACRDSKDRQLWNISIYQSHSELARVVLWFVCSSQQ